MQEINGQSERGSHPTHGIYTWMLSSPTKTLTDLGEEGAWGSLLDPPLF